jgi:hypothetical protein
VGVAPILSMDEELPDAVLVYIALHDKSEPFAKKDDSDEDNSDENNSNLSTKEQYREW